MTNKKSAINNSRSWTEKIYTFNGFIQIEERPRAPVIHFNPSILKRAFYLFFLHLKSSHIKLCKKTKKIFTTSRTKRQVHKSKFNTSPLRLIWTQVFVRIKSAIYDAMNGEKKGKFIWGHVKRTEIWNLFRFEFTGDDFILIGIVPLSGWRFTLRHIWHVIILSFKYGKYSPPTGNMLFSSIRRRKDGNYLNNRCDTGFC